MGRNRGFVVGRLVRSVYVIVEFQVGAVLIVLGWLRYLVLG